MSTFVRRGLSTIERKLVEVTEQALQVEMAEITEHVTQGKCANIEEYRMQTGKLAGLRLAITRMSEIYRQYQEE